MKTKLTVIMLTLLVAASVVALPRVGLIGPEPVATTLDNETYIDANNVLMFVTNQGSFGRDLAGVFGYDYGTFYPYNGVQHIFDGSQIASPLYASGLWMGGIDSANGDLRLKIAEYNSEYWQGPWETWPVIIDYPTNRVYKLHRDSMADNPNSDYANWIDAARQGAPFLGDSSTPAMIGDQMCWTVYHDRDDPSKYNDASNTKPVGVEIRQTTFAFKSGNPLERVIFVKFEVFNRGERTIRDFYLSLWADPDLGESQDDLVGCDTLRDLGFIYNADDADAKYGSTPPCLGYDFLQGPLVHTGNPTDTGKGWGERWAGYRNLGMESFNKYINGTDPESAEEIYNYMKGRNPDGTPYMYNGQPTTYAHSGDPVAMTGDLDFSPADRRFMLSTGPLTFRPGDSIEIVAAIIVGQGVDRLSSISAMKYTDQLVQNAYDDSCSVIAGRYVVDNDGNGVADACEHCCVGTTGNVNMEGIVDLSDLSALIAYLTGEGYVLPCWAEANVNAKGIIDLSDLSGLISYLTDEGYVLRPCP